MSGQSSRTLLLLGDIRTKHVRAAFDEEDIPRFRPGLPAQAILRGDSEHTLPLKYVRTEPFVTCDSQAFAYRYRRRTGRYPRFTGYLCFGTRRIGTARGSAGGCIRIVGLSGTVFSQPSAGLNLNNLAYSRQIAYTVTLTIILHLLKRRISRPLQR